MSDSNLIAGSSILFVDGNALWHRRLAHALAELNSTTAIMPYTSGVFRAPEGQPLQGRLRGLRIGLPPGWAYHTALISQRYLVRVIRGLLRDINIEFILLTSPAYAALAEWLRGEVPVIAYCADDYRSYAGWPAVEQRERRLMRAANLSVFVSNGLRTRAICDYALDPARTFVSPNATEARFGPDGAAEAVRVLAGRARPVLGLLGGLSDRLDLDLVRQAAELPQVGTFLVAGPASEQLLRREPWLTGPKFHITGWLPHEEMHLWAHAMDAALIPYAATDLNRYCSPMRLYDHLATGVPIFARDTCDQIVQIEAEGVITGAAETLLPALARVLPQAPRYERPIANYLWKARAANLLTAVDRVRAVA